MLLPREQSSWNCGYVLGAVALQALSQAEGGRRDLQGLQRAMSLIMNRSISATQAISAASWLFLLNAVKLNEDGTIERCS
jgi:hypothetical protein